MSRPVQGLLAGIALAWAGAAGAQAVHNYTQNETGVQRIPLGYPVPRPVASLTPVDGFRDYASLDARLRLLAEDSPDLTGHDVGQTRNGRVVRAYVVSDGDGVDVEGRAEAAFFINGGIHAREWGTPEVSTYLVERMVEGAGDAGLVRYLLDNARLVIIPVNNVDGFLQTQRFHDSVVIGQDTRVPNEWPRDGRMRRKNMPGVDENLETFADHLRGVDLNRNHPPFWGTVTNGGQLTNPNDLTYRGTAVHSEPESQALVAAAQLAPPSRIRLGVDVHTYSRVFFSSNTGRTRLNQIQARLFSLLIGHHASVPTASGQPNNAFYRDIPDPPNSGIGVAAEYFAYEWLVPAMTLELEPQNSGAEYGGTGASHSGFILPDSQVRRVREAWAESFLVAFYFMSGPPYLKAINIRDPRSGALLQTHHWERDTAIPGRRRLHTQELAPVVAQRQVHVELVFNKPMRYRDAEGAIAALPGLTAVTTPVVRRISGAVAEGIDVSAGEWLHESGYARYRDDTFRFEWTVPSSGTLRFEVATQDMAGLSLDSDPSTPVDWRDGAWSEWEDAAGVDGDVGGVDRLTASVSVSESGNPAALSLVAEPADVVGEGDRLRLRMERPSSDASGVIQVRARVGGFTEATASWADGEAGERLLELPVEDDVVVAGSRSLTWQVLSTGATDAVLFSGNVEVLDNDRAGHLVVRESEDPRSALQMLAAGDAPQRDLVLDGGREYVGPSNLLTVCQQFDLEAPMRVFGNRAALLPGSSACTLVSLRGEGQVELRDIQLDGQRGNGERIELIEVDGQSVRLERALLRNGWGYAVSGAKRVELLRSAVVDVKVLQGGRESPFGALQAGVVDVSESSLFGVARPADSELSAGASSLILTTERETSTLASISLDAFPDLFFSGQGEMRSSVYYSELGVGVPLPPVCDGLLSRGDNRFAVAGRFCFDSLPSDSAFPPVDRVPPVSGVDLAYRLPTSRLVDAAQACGPVDQRGAPRPQTLQPGAAPRCDIGSVELGVNPWRGFWQPERDGHGIDVQTNGNVLTLLWYTYALNGEPTAYLAAAPLTGPRWEADLLTASRNPQSGEISNTVVGRVNLDFESDVEATLGWQFDGRAPGSERVTAFDFAGSEPRVEVTGSWFPPAESGNGMSIARRGEVTALAVYYYDAAGVLRWALGQGSGDDAIDVELSSFTGFCPDCDAASNLVRSNPAGSARLHFRTPQHLDVDTDVTYPGANGGRWLRPDADFVPLTDPVDNREAAASLGG